MASIKIFRAAGAAASAADSCLERNRPRWGRSPPCASPFPGSAGCWHKNLDVGLPKYRWDPVSFRSSSAGRSVKAVSSPDIKILMPSNLRTLEKGLRMVGYGPNVDDFVLSMNRAAEAAAPAARKIFIDAITAMTFDDARRILSGATQPPPAIFKDKTTPQLTAAFRPVVENAMAKKRRHSAIQHAGLAVQVSAVRPEIRTSTSATTLWPRRSTGSFSNWDRKNARFARIRQPRPQTCSRKFSGGDSFLRYSFAASSSKRTSHAATSTGARREWWNS